MLSKKLKQLIEKIIIFQKLNLGFLDVTFFRDDFGRGDKILSANKTSIDFIVEDKIVILLMMFVHWKKYKSSTLTAIQSFGRPKKKLNY